MNPGSESVNYDRSIVELPGSAKWWIVAEGVWKEGPYGLR